MFVDETNMNDEQAMLPAAFEIETDLSDAAVKFVESTRPNEIICATKSQR